MWDVAGKPCDEAGTPRRINLAPSAATIAQLSVHRDGFGTRSS